ncbi:hypothetical protein AB0O34_32620 [Sphaerisporangium sp. NPDC088356]|uniref:hypothetical protein n=1 Tax=Sphaerisporangium sp. NPDC088356 TaxID=3154871 RepID=UPI003447DDE5
MATMNADDFYEDDEPIEQVLAAFERGDKRLTRRPNRGFNEHLSLFGVAVSETSTSGVLVGHVS